MISFLSVKINVPRWVSWKLVYINLLKVSIHVKQVLTTDVVHFLHLIATGIRGQLMRPEASTAQARQVTGTILIHLWYGTSGIKPGLGHTTAVLARSLSSWKFSFSFFTSSFSHGLKLSCVKTLKLFKDVFTAVAKPASISDNLLSQKCQFSFEIIVWNLHWNSLPWNTQNFFFLCVCVCAKLVWIFQYLQK